MSEYTTVFEISRYGNGIVADALVRGAIGVGALLAGIRLLIKRSNSASWSVKELIGPVIVSLWALLWLGLHYPLFVISSSELNSLLEIEQNGKANVAEVEVSVKHEQPRQGHSSGDLISIGGEDFVVDYFLATPGYNKTIAHGGVLRPGTHARVHYHDGVIFRVDISRD